MDKICHEARSRIFFERFRRTAEKTGGGMKKKVAIFVSGSGTNMENLARKAKSGELGCEVALVVCDRPDAFALKRSAKLGLEAFVIERKHYKSKEEFEAKITAKLIERGVEAIFLAGYMRILGADFVRTWRSRILNVHPSLLPTYPGAHSIEDAFRAKEKETGVTIHFVDEDVDRGPIILQKKVPIQPGDTLEALETRVHAPEY